MASTLCKYDLRKGDLFVSELGKGATSEAGKSFFRAARDNRCMYMAHVCFMCVVVTVWGSVGMLVV